MTDDDRDALRERIEHAMQPAADQVIATATRPYKRLVVWLAIGYGVLLAASVVQAVLWLVMR